MDIVPLPNQSNGQFVSQFIDHPPQTSPRDRVMKRYHRCNTAPIHPAPKPSQNNGQFVLELIDPAPEPSEKICAKKRYRWSKTAPPEFSHPATMHQTAKSLLAKLHPSFRQVLLLLAVYLGLGTICFHFLKDQMKGTKTHGVVDAMYFCIATMTTVGYGDLVPNSVVTKLLACAFVFTGMALVALFLSKAADYLVEKQEKLLVKALSTGKKVGRIKIMKKFKNHKVKHKLVMILTFLLVLILVGTVVLYTIENMDLVDAFYCVCSTITTLGFGDKSFTTHAGRIFAAFWIVTSTICLALFFLYLAELKTERRQRSLVKWVLRRRMTYIDLVDADLDHDGVLSAAEFIIYKLKQMGKISQEDIGLVLEEFEDLDVNQCGTLPATNDRC